MRGYLLCPLGGELGLIDVSLGREALDRFDGALEDHAVITTDKLFVSGPEGLRSAAQVKNCKSLRK
jgi:hypothetical protein